MLSRASLLCVALALVPGLPARAADEVVIYRCTDAAGHLTLRDTPCAKGQVQQARSMLRPKDAPVSARPAAPPQAAVAVAEARPSAPVASGPARPLYECVTPDGERYTSDTPEGSPRWVPLWTLGVPYAWGTGFRDGRSGASLAVTHGDVRLSIGQGAPRPPHLPHPPRPRYPAPYPGYTAWGSGTWVRDACYALPQEEVCARLVDRRDEIRRRFFNAQPSERDTLRIEERGINARLASDCGSY